MSRVPIAFSLEPLTLELTQLLPSRKLHSWTVANHHFSQIKSSIAEIGLIEPLSVTGVPDNPGRYLLLDGHMRLAALKELGHPNVTCLLADDDETYTYNNRLNRLSTVQEHFMIQRAIERGVPAERLARTLDIEVRSILKKLHLLDGIAPEVAELLKDRAFSVDLSRILGKMRPSRQIECAQLMVSANNLTLAYGGALLAATPAAELIDSNGKGKIEGATPMQMSRMESEMSNLRGQYRLAETTYGQDVLNLVVAQKYVAKLLRNAKVVRYLRPQHADLLEQFAAIAQAGSLES
jgi:hypothetical protein